MSPITGTTETMPSLLQQANHSAAGSKHRVITPQPSCHGNRFTSGSCAPIWHHSNRLSGRCMIIEKLKICVMQVTYRCHKLSKYKGMHGQNKCACTLCTLILSITSWFHNLNFIRLYYYVVSCYIMALVYVVWINNVYHFILHSIHQQALRILSLFDNRLQYSIAKTVIPAF